MYFLLVDEVYVKPMVSYHGGQLFCNSVSDNTQLVKTVLDFMIVCLYGGPKFLVEVLPTSKLDTDFLYDRSKMLIDQIKDSGGNLLPIICDNKKQANWNSITEVRSMLLNGTKSESFKNWRMETWSRCQNLLMWQPIPNLLKDIGYLFKSLLR